MSLFKSNKIRESVGDTILNVITSIILIAIILIIGLPLMYVIANSFSDAKAVATGRVLLWPVDFSLQAYNFVFEYKQVWIGFRNSAFYVVTEVILQMSLTILTAYPLSRRNFQGRSFYTMLFYMTTRISAGLIPLFILKTRLGLFDNIWTIILSGGLYVTNILILRTAFQSSIPAELFDSAMIDGANHFQCMLKIALPLAKATLSVLILYVIVGQWNDYFTGMIYLRNKELYPIQLVLMPIMQSATAAGKFDAGGMSAIAQSQASGSMENVRYALILITSLPVLIAYFCVQKYFKGGVMLGSVKG